MTANISMPAVAEVRMRDAILASLLQFNEQRSGYADTRDALAVLLSQPETGEIVGGLWGGTGFGHFHIDLLFVPEALRGRGLGREIM